MSDAAQNLDKAMESPERRAFENLLERMLAPLVPIAIDYGMSARDVALAARAVYLREIEARLLRERRHPISDSRLALVTGLARSEVAHIRRHAEGKGGLGSDSAAQLSRIAAVLSTWHTNPSFSGAYGLPLDLDLELNPSSPHRSFNDLIDVACSDLPQRVTLDELVANGFVEIVGGTLVRCRARAAITNSASGKVGLIEQYGRFLAAAAGTVAHNISSEDSAGYFDRLLVSDMPLTEGVRTRFYARAMSSTDALLAELDGWLSTNAEEPSDGAARHYGLGLFFFEEGRDEGAPPTQMDDRQVNEN